MKEKSIQISEKLFLDLIAFFLSGDESPERKVRIKNQIDEKMERMINRALYTQYKTDPSPEEREKARLEYLDRVGISSSFRWSKEQSG